MATKSVHFELSINNDRAIPSHVVIIRMVNTWARQIVVWCPSTLIEKGCSKRVLRRLIAIWLVRRIARGTGQGIQYALITVYSKIQLCMIHACCYQIGMQSGGHLALKA